MSIFAANDHATPMYDQSLKWNIPRRIAVTSIGFPASSKPGMSAADASSN
jgi:hypothetical protein